MNTARHFLSVFFCIVSWNTLIKAKRSKFSRVSMLVCSFERGEFGLVSISLDYSAADAAAVFVPPVTLLETVLLSSAMNGFTSVPIA